MVRSLICAVVCLFLFTSAKADTFTLTSGFAQTGLDLFDIFATGAARSWLVATDALSPLSTQILTTHPVRTAKWKTPFCHISSQGR